MSTERFPFCLASVAVFIEHDGKILMGERIYNTATLGVSQWSLPGGKMDYGETPEETAIRETKEECGLDIGNLQFLTYKTETYPSFGKHFLCLYFKAQAKSYIPINMEPKKIAQWKWVDAPPENSFGKSMEVFEKFV
jgi:8-oxo-dGTP diphosphatase